MIDVFKCFRLSASLLVDRVCLSDWLWWEHIRLSEGLLSMLQRFWFFSPARSLSYCVSCYRTVPMIDIPCCDNGPSAWNAKGLVLFVRKLTAICILNWANMENKRNCWESSVEIVLGFGFSVNWLHIHNLRTAGYSKHIVICKLL